jgi:DNA repair exonuclease SbcCD ATPase subunit
MKINFKSVTIENFMSIGNAYINMQDLGYTLVSGINNNPQDLARSNGSGKSSIFESIVWCLTSETMRGNKDIVNCYGNDGALVSLEFVLDETPYIITRTKEHSKYKTNLLIYINGENKSGKGIRDSEKLLKEYLPDLTPSLISSVIILGQGLPTRFTNNSPSGRKEVLEGLCKSDFMIEDLKCRISSRKTALQSTLREHEDKVLSAKTKLDVSSGTLVKDENLLQTLENGLNYDELISDLQQGIDVNTTKLNNYNSLYIQCNEKVNQIHNQQLTLHNEKELDLKKVEDKFREIINGFTQQKSTLTAQCTALRNEINKLNSIKDVCPTCGQKLPEVHKPDTTPLVVELQNLESQLVAVTNKHNDTVNSLNTEKQQVNSIYASKEQELRNLLVSANSELQQALTQRDVYTKTINDQQKKLTEYSVMKSNLAKNISDCKQRIQDTRQLIDTLNADILYNNNVIEDTELRIQVVNKFNTIVTRDFRGYLLQSVIEFINRKAKEYAKDIFETDLIEFVLDGNNISISYNSKQYEALSGGERQKVDLIIQFSIRDMLCQYTNFSTNILALDEIFDNLDDLGSQKIIDLISTKLSDISSVFIISHHGNELNIPCDNELIVIKDMNGVSSIK